MTTHAHEQTSESPKSQLDAWHQHPAADGMPQEEHGSHASITMLVATFVVITVATLAFSVIIGIYAISQMDKLITQREMQGLAASAPVAANYKQQALAEQSGYSWTPQGNVKLPIEQAMQLVVKESNANTHQQESPSK